MTVRVAFFPSSENGEETIGNSKNDFGRACNETLRTSPPIARRRLPLKAMSFLRSVISSAIQAS